jgi:hypothetical protein
MGYEGENNLNSPTSWDVRSTFPCPKGRLQDTTINKYLKKRENQTIFLLQEKKFLT